MGSIIDLLTNAIPLHIAVPAAIMFITLLAAALMIDSSVVQDIYDPQEKLTIKVEELWHYPVKGLGGIQLEKGTIGAQGFEDDRTFVLTKVHRDEKTGDVSVLEPMYSGFNLQMVLFQCIVEDRDKGPKGASITVTRVGPENPDPKQLTYTGHSEHQICFPLRPDVSNLTKTYLDLHGSACDVFDMGSEISAWLTKYLRFETKLFYIGPNAREVLGSTAPSGDMAIAKRSPSMAMIRKVVPRSLLTPVETITFQDIGHYLVVTQESNAEVSSRLAAGHEMDIHKFRPNIIVSGAPKAYDEDFWSQLVFSNGLKMNFGSTCWRCQAITVDYRTGKKADGEEGEVWKRLNKDRRVDKGWKYGPVFGHYSYTSLKDVGRTIQVGDRAVVTKRVKEQPVFDWPLPKAAVAAFSG
ncbi:Putative molybdenum cofactor sulfurase, pyruvate kinase-like, insert domain superfamily [Septoria linicola]|uniref:Molybdenum cofactor sulfurase, pyruvate kinase-like, insert domain superfamily n=1 Tax=Septoria linicola TaxID=215465 RepID=A0A9Q9EJW3_9PEZI|nr:Putative molybdenum cofactor sulfurase, pyruvate kinase-like, insert domain superfamily [Septoria linicola]